MGLALASCMAVRNGGGLSLSPRPGGGTRATFWLPRAGAPTRPDLTLFAERPAARRAAEGVGRRREGVDLDARGRTSQRVDHRVAQDPSVGGARAPAVDDPHAAQRTRAAGAHELRGAHRGLGAREPVQVDGVVGGGEAAEGLEREGVTLRAPCTQSGSLRSSSSSAPPSACARRSFDSTVGAREGGASIPSRGAGPARFGESGSTPDIAAAKSSLSRSGRHTSTVDLFAGAGDGDAGRGLRDSSSPRARAASLRARSASTRAASSASMSRFTSASFAKGEPFGGFFFTRALRGPRGAARAGP
ncbi:MAG: hypothetical protein R3A52_02160 [Polyangiales bacterium]